MRASSELSPRDPLRAIGEIGQRQTVLFGIVVCTISLLLPLGVYLDAQLGGDDYAEAFWGEWNAISWYSMLQLMLIGSVAYANHQANDLLKRLGGTKTAKYPWIWILFAAGFVFLGLDERFQYHEWLRDEVFRPEGLFNFSFLRAGDVTMYGYLFVGLVLASFLFRELLDRPLALVFFCAAVLLAGVAVVLDTLSKDLTVDWEYRDFWTSAFEESGELWAQSLFLVSFLVVLYGRLQQLTLLRSRPPE